MIGRCTGCGGCCDPVIIPRRMVTKTRVAGDPDLMPVAPGASDGERCRSWIRDDLTRISRTEALRRRPAIALGATSGQFFYACRHYDRETRRCLDYDNRPSICRGFPWYGKEPTAAALEYLPECGYREDLV